MTRVILPKAIEVVAVYGAVDVIVEILGIPPPGGGGGAAAWGGITGTLADQTDLQDALDGKEATGTAAAAVAAHVAAPDPHTQYALETDVSTALALKQALSAKDQIGGYAGLDGFGKINPLQLPAIAITDTFVVNTEAAMLALAAETGDIAVRTDLPATFILRGDDPTVLADWQELESPTDAVSSVFGRAGTVTAQNGDYNTNQVTEGSNLYFTGARAIASLLTGYVEAAVASSVAATDSILVAFGKIGKRITDLAAAKQDNLVSGTNIKTVNGTTLLGAGDLLTSEWTYSILSADFAVTSTTAADAFGITLPVNKLVEIEAVLFMSTSVSGDAPRPGWKWPTAGAAFGAGMAQIMTGTTTVTSRIMSASEGNADLTGTATPSTTDAIYAKFHTLLRTTSPVTGNFIVTFRGETANTATLLKDSFVRYRAVNKQ